MLVMPRIDHTASLSAGCSNILSGRAKETHGASHRELVHLQRSVPDASASHLAAPPFHARAVVRAARLSMPYLLSLLWTIRVAWHRRTLEAMVPSAWGLAYRPTPYGLTGYGSPDEA